MEAVCPCKTSHQLSRDYTVLYSRRQNFSYSQMLLPPIPIPDIMQTFLFAVFVEKVALALYNTRNVLVSKYCLL
jgi:hypothetical protein